MPINIDISVFTVNQEILLDFNFGELRNENNWRRIIIADLMWHVNIMLIIGTLFLMGRNIVTAKAANIKRAPTFCGSQSSLQPYECYAIQF